MKSEIVIEHLTWWK